MNHRRFRILVTTVVMTLAAALPADSMALSGQVSDLPSAGAAQYDTTTTGGPGSGTSDGGGPVTVGTGDEGTNPGTETPGSEVPGEETPGEETPGEEAPGEEEGGDAPTGTGGGDLPFTGLLAIPILLAGAVLAGTGVALRRRTRSAL